MKEKCRQRTQANAIEGRFEIDERAFRETNSPYGEGRDAPQSAIINGPARAAPQRQTAVAQELRNCISWRLGQPWGVMTKQIRRTADLEAAQAWGLRLEA
jgi:hypothetical protein